VTITGIVIKNIIRKLLAGQDYRASIIALIDAEFLQYVVDFFKRVAYAKLENQSVTIDWYKKELLDSGLPKEEIAIHSGLNMKTISNMYNSGRREIVLEASIEHYEALYNAIASLTAEGDVDICLTIKFRNVSVDLNVNESLIVINTIAVKRAALHRGLWSTAGKQVEKPLMTTLCALFRVPTKYFNQSSLPASVREVDFYLLGDSSARHCCEVKLMGKGNPESADAVVARNSRVFVADKLSESNKKQLDSLGILWVELRDEQGYKRFEQVLSVLSIPHTPFTGDMQKVLDKIFPVIFTDDVQQSVTPDVVLQEERSGPYSSEFLVEFDDEF
jgi:hypothetical protein